MRTVAKIYRFDPEKDSAGYYVDFEYEMTGGENILDVLIRYQREEPDFAFSYSCRDRHCGLCGVMMNGQAVLACKKSAEPDMTISPLKGMRVIKDLLIDRNAVLSPLSDQQLFLQRDRDPERYPEPLPQNQYQEVKLAIRCVECLCCQASCPVWQKKPHLFAGPTAFVMEAQYAFDRRDSASRALTIQNMGIEHCIQCGKCDKACVHGISPSVLIKKMKGED